MTISTILQRQRSAMPPRDLPAQHDPNARTPRLRRPERQQEAPRDRLDRCERVVDLMTQHAHEPLPGLQLLFAERLAHVREDEQRVRTAILSKQSATYFPAPRSPREGDIHGAR